MDYLIRGIARKGNIRFFIANTKDICQTAHDNHQTTPTVSAALGRLLTAGAIMGRMQKDDTRITIKVDGDGPIGSLLVDANANGQVRGFARNPLVDLPLSKNGKLDVGSAVGHNGSLIVIKDLGLKENFSSQTRLQSGEIGDDISYYFLASEQMPSVVGLGVLVNIDHNIKYAGGYILQLMPSAVEDDFVFLEELARKYSSVTDLLSKYSIEEIAKLFFGEDLELDKQTIEFVCPCSKERFIEAVSSIKKEEIQEIIDEDHGADITCEFCGKNYHLDEHDLLKSLKLRTSNDK